MSQTEPDEDAQWTIDRAADLLEHYAAFIRGGHSNELLFHPYLPEIDFVAAQLRAWFKSESSSLLLDREEAGGEIAVDGGGREPSPAGVKEVRKLCASCGKPACLCFADESGKRSAGVAGMNSETLPPQPPMDSPP